MAFRVRIGGRPSSPPSQVGDSQLPLQITLAFLVCQNFPRGPGSAFTIGTLGHVVTSQLLGIVAREFLEIAPEPSTFQALVEEMDSIIRSATGDGQLSAGEASFLKPLLDYFASVDAGCAFLDVLEKDIRDRVSMEDEYDATQYNEAIDRRSPVGQFLRKLLLILRALSFDQSAHVARLTAHWLGVVLPGPSRPLEIPASDRRIGMDDALERRTAAVRARRRAEAQGDYSATLNSIRRFYDFPFPGTDRHQHQHGLLNLAAFHLDRNEIISSRSALDEAIRVARQQSDASCLKRCMSLARRLDHLERPPVVQSLGYVRIHQAPLPIETLPQTESPMDDLWSISAALDLGEPVHVAVRRLYSALVKHEYSAYKPGEEQKAEKEKKAVPSGWLIQQEMDPAIWHATQARLWALLGSNHLALTHEELALDCPDIDLSTVNLILFNRAHRLAQQGRFEQAIADLIAPSLLNNLDHAGYLQWIDALRGIMHARATSLRDPISLDILAASLPDTRDSSRNTSGMPIPARVTEALRKARKLQDAHSPAQIILPHINSAVKLSRELGLWAIYRSASLALAETLLSMDDSGAAQRALDVLDSIWSQVMGSKNEEDMARGALVRAKAKISIAMDQGSFASQTDDILHLLHSSLKSSRSVASAVLEDEAIQLFSLLSELRGARLTEEAHLDNFDCSERLRQQTRDICEIVKLVGVHIIT